MVNATELLRQMAPSKLIGDWLRTSSAQAKIEQFCDERQIGYKEAVRVVKGGQPKQQGTWLHPDLLPILESWAMSPADRKFMRDEAMFGNFLIDALKDIAQVIPQYRIGRYAVDFYLPEQRIVIEYDEGHHFYRSTQDAVRQAEIHAALNCHFVRVAQGEEARGLNQLLRLLLS